MRLAFATASSSDSRRGSRRLRDLQLFEKLVEALAVFGEVDRLRRGADDRHAGRLQRKRKIQRRLSAELHDDADRRSGCGFVLVDLHHVFERERLEVETVAGVVIGRDRLRIAVHHDRLVAVVAQREGRVAAAVIELDSLPDAIRTAAENDDLLAVGRRRFVFFFVGRVEIRREAFELGRAGIDALVDRADAARVALLVDQVRGAASVLHLPQVREPLVGEAHALEFAQFVARRLRPSCAPSVCAWASRNVLQLVQEPGIDLRQVMHLLDRPAMQQRMPHVLQALGMRGDQPLGDDALFDLFRRDALARLQRADAFHQGLLEGAADRHHLADRLHLRTERSVGAGKFLELPLGNLDDHVVERRLEAGRRLARDVVGDLVERIADRQLAAIFAIGKPVAFDASAEERETRGFISITTMRPFFGLMANWMFDPPVSTPISRMTVIAASRMIWYSRSVSVCAGATVIESPVCTPMGSKFSIEQMTMTLSARSRITSSSYSFQPSTDSSSSTSCTGERSSPFARSSISSSRL